MSGSSDLIVVARDCDATTVPYGSLTTLPAGTEVRILQALGGNVTVRDTLGRMFRISGNDADVVGLEPLGASSVVVSSDPFTLEQVWNVLRDVYDPEMSLNVVELGLIYRCEEQVGSDDQRTVSIDMTMTAPGCGMGDVLRDDVIRSVGALPGVDDVEVTIVFDPPWCIDRIAEDVRLSLGLL